MRRTPRKSSLDSQLINGLFLSRPSRQFTRFHLRSFGNRSHNPRQNWPLSSYVSVQFAQTTILCDTPHRTWWQSRGGGLVCAGESKRRSFSSWASKLGLLVTHRCGGWDCLYTSGDISRSHAEDRMRRWRVSCKSASGLCHAKPREIN